MAAGMRPVDPSYDPERDPAYGEALQRYEMRQPMAPPPLPELEGGLPPPASFSSWLSDFQQPAPSQAPVGERLANLLPQREPNRRIQGPTLDLSVFDHDPQARMRDNGMAMERMFGPVGRPMPQSDPKTTRGPMVSAPAKAASPRQGGAKTQLALHFARVMGMETPGEVDSPEEQAFAKAAHAAMLKMSKGQSVAKFLSQMNSAKASATFRTLMARSQPKGPPHAAPGARP